MKSILMLIVALSMTVFLFTSFGQAPPHPLLLEKIRNGEIEKPYALTNIEKIRARGVDMPWSSPHLRKLNEIQSINEPQRMFGSSVSPTGSWNALMILVQFSDKPAQVVATSFDNLIFKDSTGTLRNYYKHASYSKLDIVTVNLPSSIGWVKAPQTYSYYVNGVNGFGSYPQNAQKLVEDAVALAATKIDFSKYDNDGDGYVDGLFIVHTGPGAELTGSNNDIWSHSWTTSSPQSYNGVQIYHYAMEPEYWVTPGDMTIGVYAHELGHAAFGLPDLYDTDYSSTGLGNWSIMAGGSWNGYLGSSPSYPDAWCRIQMGFAMPKVVTANVLSQAIPEVEDSAKIFKLWKNGTPGSEYFLVENRQLTSYDQSLPNGGLLIYHVDDSVATNNNEWYPGHTSSGHYRVALEQADGLFNLEKNNNRGDPGDCYPGSQNNTSFTNSSVPNSQNYHLSATGVSVKNISISSFTMHADLVVIATDTILKVVFPNGGEKWPAGYTKQIVLNALNTGTLKLEYTIDSGATWNSIGDVNPSISKVASTAVSSMAYRSPKVKDIPAIDAVYTGSVIDWIVPNSPSKRCKVRVTDESNQKLTDQSDSAFTIFSPPAGQFSVEFNYNALSVTGGDGNLGVVFLPSTNQFWTSRWGSNLLHRWTAQGTLVDQFSISGVSNVMGMTFDGTYIYATSSSTTISIIDPTAKTLKGTITAPLKALFIAYDPTADNGNGGFWIGSWYSNLILINRSGVTLRTLPFANLGSSGNSGLAYDSYSSGGPYLWLASQDNSQLITQVSVATGSPTGIQHDILSNIGLGSSGSYSGGIFVSSGIVSGKATIGGILQGYPDKLYGYQLCDLAPNITVLSPNGGEVFRAGKSSTIRWTSGLVSNVKVEYTINNGTNWNTISASTTASNYALSWTVPSVASTQCKIKISDASNSALFDLSDNPFTITLKAPTTETEPNNTAATANNMEYGDSLAASISPKGDVDYYKFTASAKDTVEIYAADGNTSSLEGELFLYNAAGNLLAYDWWYTTLGNQKIIYPISSAGTYYIRYACNWGNFPNGTPRRDSLHKFTNILENVKNSPSLVSYDSGAYYIKLKKYTPVAPALSSFGFYYMDYNAIDLRIALFPNGLNTTVTLDYGTTSKYGTSIRVTESPVNSLGEYDLSCLLTTLQPNTIYHFRITLANSAGTTISGDLVLQTPALPDGFVFQNSGTSSWLYGVSFSDANNGCAVGLSGIILRTTNGGTTWTQQTSGTNYDLFSVSFTDANNGFAVGANGILLHTTNGGANWTQQVSGTYYELSGVYFTEANKGCAVGYAGKILHTTNGGANWIQQTSGTNNALWGVSFADANNGCAVGDGGTILRTTNGGTTWTQQASGTSNALYGVSFTDANNGCAVGTGGIILRTTNGGTTWVKQTSGMYYYLYGVSFIDANNGCAVGDYGTILRTTNGGTTWVPHNSGTTAFLLGLSYKNNNITIVGSDGKILRSAQNNNLTMAVSPSSSGTTTPAVGVYTYNKGTVVNISATPASGYRFVKWTGGVADSTKASTTVTVSTNKIVTAYFQKTYTLTMAVSPEGGGTTTPAVGVQTCDSGTVVNISATPAAGYRFVKWICGTATSTFQSTKTTMNANRTLTAVFLKTYTLTMAVSPVGGGATTPAVGVQTCDSGTVVNISTTPAAGYRFVKWICGTATSTFQSTKTTMNANRTLTAIFQKTYTLTMAVSPEGGGTTTPAVGVQTCDSGTVVNISATPAAGYRFVKWICGTATSTFQSTKTTMNANRTLTAIFQKTYTLTMAVSPVGGGTTTPAVGVQTCDSGTVVNISTTPTSGYQFVKWTGGVADSTKSSTTVTVSANKTVTAVFGFVLKTTIYSSQYADCITISPKKEAYLPGEKVTLIACAKENCTFIKWSGDVNDTSLQIEIIMDQEKTVSAVFGNKGDLKNQSTNSLPKDFSLSQNYPNPFNPSTQISFALPEDAQVTLEIYNILGTRVRTLLHDIHLRAGVWTETWNGLDECGYKATSGMYFYRFQAGSFITTKKMVMVK